MLRFPQRLVFPGIACALLVAVGFLAWGLTTGSSEAQAGTMHNCPTPGKWSIAVWDGDSGATADDALATCGAGTVAAAYSLDAQTGGWSRWFAGKPDVSNFLPLNGMQGILALGATPTPTPAPTPAPTADLTAREISDEELADMTIPVAELGSAYADFVGWGQFSGFLTNADIQDKAEADDVQRFGRVNGYRYTYSTLDVLLGKTTEGVLSIGTNVTMYEEPTGASDDLKDEIQERRSRVGTTNSEGLTWRDVQEFDPGPIADESAGLVETVSGQELTYHTTTVWCRRGRLLAFIAIVRFDDENVREEAAALARKLDERILTVLQGD